MAGEHELGFSSNQASGRPHTELEMACASPSPLFHGSRHGKPRSCLLYTSSDELNSVKSNEAYKALVLEIEAAKKEKILLEDQVLVLMEKIEVLQKESKIAEAESQKRRGDLEAQDRALDAEEAELKSKAEAKKAERESFAGGLSADVLSRYESIQRGRPGFVAVVPINAMVCGGCRTGLTPNLDVYKRQELYRPQN